MNMHRTRRSLLSLGMGGLAAALLLPSQPSAQANKPPVFADFASKLAIDGYDAVAYFKTGQPVKGVPAHAVTWNGASWRFASAENKAAFQAYPAGVRAAIRWVLRLGRLGGLYGQGRSQALAHRRRQALPQLQRLRANRLGKGHPGTHLQGRQELAERARQVGAPLRCLRVMRDRPSVALHPGKRLPIGSVWLLDPAFRLERT